MKISNRFHAVAMATVINKSRKARAGGVGIKTS